MHGRFSRGVVAAGLPAATTGTAPVTEEDLARLPAVVRRYLRFMGGVGRPRDWSFQARFAGRFRLRPGTPWMALDSWQYNSSLAVARLLHADPFRWRRPAVRLGYIWRAWADAGQGAWLSDRRRRSG